MKKTLIGVDVLAAVAVPVAAGAQPTKTDRTDGSKECKAERGNSAATREAFKLRYGTFGKCVSKRSREEAAERAAAHDNAAWQCKEERGTTDAERQAFAVRYGENDNDRNPFGKCVSQKARAKKAAMDAKDRAAIRARKSAAKQCAAERKLDADAFRAKWAGGRRNAFGKCVSATARNKS